MNRTLRTALVGSVVVASILVGAFAIRAAAAWTAASAPLVARPVSAVELSDRLAAEQARTADLQARLDEITSQSAGLVDALRAATDRVASDTATASDLRAKLKAAQRKLTTLERSLRAAAARQVINVAPGITTASVHTVARTTGPVESGERQGADD